MRRMWIALAGVLWLAACSQPTQVAPPTGQDILQDMRQVGVSPEAIQAYEQSLQSLEAARLGVSGQATGDLQLVQTIGLGSIANYNNYYAAQASYPQFDWSRDGCSTSGMGLGYTDTFRPACNVHDFGYRNFHRYTTLANETARKQVDDNFLNNMNSICYPKSWLSRAACYSAAYAYYTAVRTAGWAYFY